MEKFAVWFAAHISLKQRGDDEVCLLLLYAQIKWRPLLPYPVRTKWRLVERRPVLNTPG